MHVIRWNVFSHIKIYSLERGIPDVTLRLSGDQKLTLFFSNVAVSEGDALQHIEAANRTSITAVMATAVFDLFSYGVCWCTG